MKVEELADAPPILLMQRNRLSDSRRALGAGRRGGGRSFSFKENVSHLISDRNNLYY